MSLRDPADSGGARPTRPKNRPRPVETPASLPAAPRHDRDSGSGTAKTDSARTATR